MAFFQSLFSYDDMEPGDDDAPVALSEYHGFKVGGNVLYQNPAWQLPDGTYKTGGMEPPLVVSEIVYFDTEEGPYVIAVLNEGEWEVNADNLVPVL